MKIKIVTYALLSKLFTTFIPATRSEWRLSRSLIKQCQGFLAYGQFLKWKYMLLSTKVDPKDGDKKTKKKFALFPKWVDNEKRWLEYYVVEYRYIIKPRSITCMYTGFNFKGNWGDWDEVRRQWV